MHNKILQSSILIIDDKEDNVRFLERLFTRHDYENLYSTTDSRETLRLVRATQPDLILLDLMMPDLSGFEVMEQLKGSLSAKDYLPILVLTADQTHGASKRALSQGAMDLLTKPLIVDEVLQRSYNLLHTRQLHLQLRDYNASLEQGIHQRTRTLKQLNDELKNANAALTRANAEILSRLAKAAEYRDDDTGQHTVRVGRLAGRIAQHLGLSKEDCQLIAKAARLHDLGKIGIPDRVLLKPGRFSQEERAMMQQHCQIGADLITGSDSKLLQMAESIALSHHERWDGMGYPHQLSAEEIPIEGRIVAVADVFDALTHARPYKEAWTVDDAVNLLAVESGHHFDPQVVDACLTVLKEDQQQSHLLPITQDSHLLANPYHG